MRRMSSLPTLESCGMSDQLMAGVNTSNAFRSTVFHAYCETGEWPATFKNLSAQDQSEIRRWKKPTDFIYKEPNLRLKYSEADKERILGLDNDFNFLPLDSKLSQEELQKIPNLMTAGHLDMAWDVPEFDLVVISDIKSSVFAVKDRCESLQLHAYGLAYSLLKGRSKYITGIWDASDGKHYYGNVTETSTFDYEAIKERIRTACNNDSTQYTKGTHCSGCWKRDSCPAHLVDLGDQNRFSKLFDGTATETDIREALVAAKGLGELANKVSDRCKEWVKSHGPVRSEDGCKMWQARLRTGRKSLNQEKIMSDLGLESLDKYMDRGEDYLVFDWLLIKE
jgi:hypothetical protein